MGFVLFSMHISCPKGFPPPANTAPYVCVPALHAGTYVGLAILQYGILLLCSPAWKISQNEEGYHFMFRIKLRYIKSLHFHFEERVFNPNGELLYILKIVLHCGSTIFRGEKKTELIHKYNYELIRTT